MIAYFDIENLSSYIKSKAKDAFEDCNRMIKRQFDLVFNFTKEELQKESKNNPAILMWITQMTQGIAGKITYSNGSVFPVRPLKSNTHKSFNREQLSAAYLINDPRIANIKENGCILYSGVGEEVEVLSSLFKDEDYQFQKDLEIRKMNSWNNLNPYMMPATDIIIVDQYCFSDETLYENNIFSLINVLCQKIKNSAINITILTLPSNFDRKSRQNFTPDWGNIKTVIKRKVKSITGFEPKVTFVLSNTLEEHDRTIFTNYQYFVSGDTINYFNSKNELISNGRHFSIKSLARRDHLEAMSNFIDDMQAIINNVKRLNADNIKYDKESCFLSF